MINLIKFNDDAFKNDSEQSRYFRDELKDRFNLSIVDGNIDTSNIKLPPTRNAPNKKLVSITLSPKVVDDLAAYCLEHDLKKSTFIESLIKKAIYEEN